MIDEWINIGRAELKEIKSRSKNGCGKNHVWFFRNERKTSEKILSPHLKWKDTLETRKCQEAEIKLFTDGRMDG